MTSTAQPSSPRPPRRRGAGRRLATVAGLTLLLLGLTAGPALAHIDVEGDAGPGQTALLTFRIPSESPTQDTTKITITLPTDTPLASVRAEQIPGWTATLTKVRLPRPVTTNNMTLTEAVGTVTFTADPGFGLTPGTFGQFRLLAGPLPDTPTLAFPTVQTYGNGEAVNWNQPETPGGEEPNYPVPTLTLSAHPQGSPETTPPGPATVTAAPNTAAPSSTAAQVISVIALLLAAVALLIAAVAWRTRFRRPAPADSDPAAAGRQEGPE